jgi:hypothetical protein
MRFLILKDKKISEEQLDELERQFTDLVYEATGLSPVFFVEERDYSHVPTESDSDGDLKPTRVYTTKMIDGVHKVYGDYGVDHVILLIHQDNWIFTGIWGVSYSYLFKKYHVEICRFDKKNMANSLGTLYHEVMHTFDALLKVEIGFDVNTLNLAPSYDKFVVHGGRPDQEGKMKWRYIRHKENTEALTIMAPHIKLAYQARKDKYNEPLRNVQKWVISFLRGYLNQKKGQTRF